MVSHENTQLQTFTPCRKLRLDSPTCWAHHRGGWTYVISLIRDNLSCEDGVLFVSSVEDTVIEETVIREPWVGVVHQVKKNNYKWFPDLERLVVSDTFLASLKTCKGLFTLSSTVKEYLQEKIHGIPVVRLWYPATPTDVPFQPDTFQQSPTRNVICIGEFMRNFQYFYNIELPDNMQKILLKSPDVDFEKLGVEPNSSVKTLEYVPEEDYDKLLSTSVVFLNLFDAPANTTVIECITRGTPIVVNRLPGIEEYLGREYPLFYDTVEEAKAILTSDKTLMKGMEYLKSLTLKPKLESSHFIYSIQNSSIYRALPTPSSHTSQTKRFKSYDMTVVICSYKRVYNMSKLLQCFVDQTTNKSFEVILWNNNFEAKDELQSICNSYADRLDLKIIHSTENYYCIIRLAAASLMRSDIMMICDDDVVPTPDFLKVYWEKHLQYGPEAVLCCRGHKFWEHTVNEENPGECWMEYENLRFFDEKHEDVQIHFLHADTCLFPKKVLLKAIQYPLPSYDVILVDDYWLSFVFSHHLRVPIWKIKGDNLFVSTPCAEDANIALYLNSRVREERINFYLYHMRQGWPNNVILEEEEAEE